MSILVIRRMTISPIAKSMHAASSSATSPSGRLGELVDRAGLDECRRGRALATPIDHDDVGAGHRARHDRLDLALGVPAGLERRRHVRQRAHEVAARALLDGQRVTSTASSREGMRSAEVLHRALEGLADADLLQGDLQLGRGGLVELLDGDLQRADHRQAGRRRRWTGSRASSGSCPMKRVAALRSRLRSSHIHTPRVTSRPLRMARTVPRLQRDQQPAGDARQHRQRDGRSGRCC